MCRIIHPPALLLCGIALALAACAHRIEAQRLAAPGGGVDAVLEASDLGGELDYDVRIVPSGAAAGTGALGVHFSGVKRPARGTAVQMQWLQPDRLLVNFTDARSQELAKQPVTVAGHVVHIELEQGGPG
jgi:hypothetical protein